jgi:predicted dehydrogenase
LQGGAIGDLQYARAYWNGGPVRFRPRTDRQSELEYQLRNWYHFTWLGGDHVVEQHIHNLDVINWLVQSRPIEAQGQGGQSQGERELHSGAAHGQVYDHHVIEYTYANGFKLFSQCRQMQGCWRNVGEYVHGTRGTADISNALIRDADGRKFWHSEAVEASGRGWHQEFDDLFTAIRRGEIPNECESAAISTMTAILGRLATYSGKIVTWDQAFHSDLKLADTDRLHHLGDNAPVLPDRSGNYPVAKPGSSPRLV